jgi:A2L zinc ribbon domain
MIDTDEMDDLVSAEDADRPIDQIHCKECGRPMIIWADVPLKDSDLTCARCKQGLAPEWEY